MRKFVLNRIKDKSGVSGTGIVAHGIQFMNGKCAMAWMTNVSSVTIYDSIEDVEKIHGHEGHTQVVWIEQEYTINGIDRFAEDRSRPGPLRLVAEKVAARLRDLRPGDRDAE